MVEFGQDYVGAQTFAENNALTYKLTIKASNKNTQGESCVLINDNQITTECDTGINVWVINNIGKLDNTMCFDVSTESGITAFITFLKEQTSGIICLASSNELDSTQVLADYMKSIGSASWNNFMISKIKTVSYAAVYRPELKSIVLESIQYSDGIKEDELLELETIFDSNNSIGITGFPGSIVYDYKEYTSIEQDYKKWPTNLLNNKLSDYGLKPGDWVSLSASIFGDKELKDDGGWTRIDCRWVFGNAWKQSFYLESTLKGNYPVQSMVNPDIWESKTVYSQIPEGVDGFVIIASRYNSDLGHSAVKNVAFGRAAEPIIEKSDRQIGINGIRNSFVKEEEQKVGSLLSLLNLKDKSDTVSSINFKEI
ncbi:long tail fiber protein proximal connector [Proteus phage phiP4-3]|uniref:Long tail fiber proximal connector n=1 Tax=Proteus phage phiP4-3 TaxID=2065203 RepID=A0A2I6PF78_9CAUD|nr:long tail fiber protein proximal connector [Proteus phage phiP4-3]AUM58376.1 long tail fiber proximal connector [Proteus phage phiP4-3]